MKNTLFVFLGKSASGKDSIMKKFIEELHMIKVPEITTRPKREGEEEGKNYYFVTNEEFDKEVELGEIRGATFYDTDKGIWKYGIRIEDLVDIVSENDSGAALITNPITFTEMVEKKIFKHVNVVVIYVHRKLKKRLVASIKRDTLANSEEILNRFLRDEHDFDTNEFLNALEKFTGDYYSMPYVKTTIHMYNNSGTIEENVNDLIYDSLFEVIREIRRREE